jgi:hypothetical protein
MDSAERSMDLMSCKNVVPLYTSTVYEGTCENSITGAAWIFGCFFVISFFGMLMIMFRGAYYPIYYYNGGKDWDSNTSDDEAELQEEMSEDDNSEDYDESMVDTDVYDEDGLAKALDEDDEEEEGTEYDQEESVEEISNYTGGESNQ